MDAAPVRTCGKQPWPLRALRQCRNQPTLSTLVLARAQQALRRLPPRTMNVKSTNASLEASKNLLPA
eukprot:CAMPEP_0204341260 /NCGR_PEP_ID=MMETSP0469-20131031/23205_1 /ASSEMBLY_ACC=CAM_ASM_000384 /TAXON_ID=2969 /ORGANISM="Oxyrrhis marina" /LENGTH=66 /DNA_ID=CAMNT_0051325943 /DNA_START=451 /DNA_END=651 /DNA_ORIENTATION=-